MTATALPIRPKGDVGLDERAEHDAQAYRAPTEQDPFADRKRWTQKDCDVMETAGLLSPGEYELLDGGIVEKVGQFAPHSRANLRVAFALTLMFGIDYVLIPVSVPVNDENSPEPDALVTTITTDQYTNKRKPLPSELRLAVEVSDTTLWRDRNTKMVLYAQAGVPEYWVLDIKGRKLWRHLDPSPAGYVDIKELDEAASLTPLAAPAGAAPVRVIDLLP